MAARRPKRTTEHARPVASLFGCTLEVAAGRELFDGERDLKPPQIISRCVAYTLEWSHSPDNLSFAEVARTYPERAAGSLAALFDECAHFHYFFH